MDSEEGVIKVVKSSRDQANYRTTAPSRILRWRWFILGKYNVSDEDILDNKVSFLKGKTKLSIFRRESNIVIVCIV